LGFGETSKKLIEIYRNGFGGRGFRYRLEQEEFLTIQPQKD
jgi:hypothetical protein